MIMTTNVNDIIKKLSPAQRKKVEARAAQLIAEENDLAGAAARAQAHAGPGGQKTRDHAGQRFAT